jgi:hypothetical protein
VGGIDMNNSRSSLSGARRAGQSGTSLAAGESRHHATPVPRGYFKPMVCSLITVYRGLRPKRVITPVSAQTGDWDASFRIVAD